MQPICASTVTLTLAFSSVIPLTLRSLAKARFPGTACRALNAQPPAASIWLGYGAWFHLYRCVRDL
jgi:hypothetical protein